jgi:hypothetical protein
MQLSIQITQLPDLAAAPHPAPSSDEDKHPAPQDICIETNATKPVVLVHLHKTYALEYNWYLISDLKNRKLWTTF